MGQREQGKQDNEERNREKEERVGRSVKEGETITEGKKGRGRSVKKRRDYQEKRRGRERRGE